MAVIALQRAVTTGRQVVLSPWISIVDQDHRPLLDAPPPFADPGLRSQAYLADILTALLDLDTQLACCFQQASGGGAILPLKSFDTARHATLEDLAVPPDHDLHRDHV